MSNNVYQMVTDRIVEMMNNGIIPWRKPWHFNTIADALEATGMSRTQALAVVATAGAFLNMESGMTFDEGFKYYAGI